MQNLKKGKREKKGTHDDQAALGEVLGQLNPVREGPQQVPVRGFVEEGPVPGHQPELVSRAEQEGRLLVEGIGEVDHLAAAEDLGPGHLVRKAQRKDPQGRK